MGPIGLEQLELFALELLKIAVLDFLLLSNIYNFLLLSNIYKYKPMSTKLGHNEYEHKISDKFDYWSSDTRSASVICPLNRKIELQ